MDKNSNNMLGGIIAGAGSAIGGFANIFSNNSANRTNMRIAQMNNEFNEKMFDKQIAYEKEMWDKQNAYNTPAEQAKRLLEAGLNPALIMGSSNTGTAGSAGNVSPPSASPASVQPNDFSFLGDAASKVIAQLNMEREMQRQDDLAQSQIMSTIQANTRESIKLMNQTAESHLARKHQQIQNDIQEFLKNQLGRVYQMQEEQHKDALRTADVQRQYTLAQKISLDLANDENSWYNKRLNAEQQVRLAKIMADKSLALAQTENYKAKTTREWSDYNHKLIMDLEEELGVKLDNEAKEYVNRKVKAEADLLERRLNHREWYEYPLGSGIKAFWDALTYPVDKATHAISPIKIGK